MTDVANRLSWVHDDDDLVELLNERWADWDRPDDDGLAKTLDDTPEWSGWEQWDDDEKRSRLGDLLAQWYPPETADDDPLAWVDADAGLVARLDGVWPGWRESGADGLIGTLDGTSEWNGWADWDADARRTYLAETLDSWYPPESAADDDDPLAWVEADGELVARLDGVWPGWRESGADGLIGTLDGTSEWNGWADWDADARRTYLAETLDAWYPAESVTVEEPEPVGADVTDLAERLAEVLAAARERSPKLAALSDEDTAHLLAEVLTEQTVAMDA